MTKTMTCPAFTKAVTEDPNTGDRYVEQIVSVFGNVDLGKDRVVAGAFSKTLTEWQSSPDVLSAYFSHQWADPFMNIGGVVEATELFPGDERLPDTPLDREDGKTLRDLGGLLVGYKIDPAGLNPTADQVFYLLSQRRITQASFAYDVVDSKRNSDGTTDLIELKLHEVGPTLLGMNPVTTLLSAKDRAQLAKEAGVDEKDVEAVIDALAKQNNHTFIPSEEDPSRCGFPDCGKTQGAVAHIDRLNSEPAETKAFVSLTGSVEERQAAIFALAEGWASENDIGNGGFFGVQLEATFADRAVFRVEGWGDPWGGGEYYEAAVTENEDGTLSLSDFGAVAIEATTVRKSVLKAFGAGNLAGNDKETAKSQGKTDEPPEAKVDDLTKSDSASEMRRHAAAARVRLQLHDLSEG